MFNYTVLAALLAAATALAVSQTTQQTYRQEFAEVPPYWQWIDEYHDANIDRQIKDGMVRYTKRTNSYNWSLYQVPHVPGKPWSITSTMSIYSGTGTNGPGVIMMVPDYRFYFGLGADGSYWIGRIHNTKNQWEALNTGRDGKTNSPVRLNGQPNVLTIQYDGSVYRMSINGTTVEELKSNESWRPLEGRLNEIGIVACGVVDAGFDNFEVTYVQPPIPLHADAFKGAKKFWLKEFDMPNARYPVLAPNGKQLYYVANFNDGKDDIFYADATSDSTWTMGRSVGTPLNNTEPNNVLSVSQDGNQLVVYGTYTNTGAFAGGGYSTTTRTANGWSVPQAITSHQEGGISATREECVTADRSVMIVSREIPGKTKGGKDLYVSFRQADGSYSSLTNLGDMINSEGLEGMPFLAADGKTLYFSSNQDGYGSDDMFVSKRLDDTWTNWTERVNMGPTINTPGWDGYFCIHPSGRWAYMNSSDGYKSGIVRVSLPNNPASRALLPDPVMLIEGRVFNANTKAPLSVKIVYSNLETGDYLGTAISEPKNGDYSIVLNAGRKYGFNAEETGYFPVSENIDLDTLKEFGVVKRDLYLVPINTGSVIRLNNLFFDTDKWDLKHESTAELERLVTLLQQNNTMRIEIRGHTDDRGTDAHNNKLSQNRANAVFAYLTEHGIPQQRLTAKGYGETMPVTVGTTDEIRQQNRRVEFMINSME